MPRKVKEGTAVAWLGKDHPEASSGEGFYEIVKDNEHELNENKHPVFTNTEVEYGRKLDWVKTNPDPEGEPANAENNEGHFVYAQTKAEAEAEANE